MRAGAIALTTFLLLTLFNSVSLFAQGLNTGKVEGTVRDVETGSPLAGAQVAVEGTRLGNVTNADGYYFILNVPPGLKSITFTFTGYQKTTVANVLVLAGQTMTVDAGLSSTIIELTGITIQGESEVLLVRDNVMTKHRLTAERLDESPNTRLEDLITLEPGVNIGGEGGLARGMSIRGGRVGEEAMVIDGMLVRNYTANPFREGPAWLHKDEKAYLGQDTSPLDLSTDAVEEVDIITGGFQAEYGDAQSGIVNIVTKEGGPSLRGNVRFTTDQINPRTADWGYNQLRVNLGGPVFNVPNLYFHASGEIRGMADNYPTHADEGFRGINQDFVDRLNNAVRNDPQLGETYQPFNLEELQMGREFYASKTGSDASLWSPPNPVRLPGNWSDNTLLSEKLTYSPIKGLKIIGSHNWSRLQKAWPQGYNGSGDYFQTGIVYQDQLPYRDWGTDTSTIIHQHYARRTRTSNMLLGFDWSILTSSERNAMLQFRATDMRVQDINNASLKTGWERETFMSWSLHDLQFDVETYPNRVWPKGGNEQYFPDGITGWYQYFDWETPFATEVSRLYWISYRYTREHQNSYKGDFDFQFNRQNRLKLGVQYTDLDNNQFETHNMSTSKREDPRDQFKYGPDILGVYLQNRTDLGDFVFDYGLRYDQFRPKLNWGIRSTDEWGENTFPQTMKSWSPRFNVAFPVTDKAQLRFSYGTFTQLPGLDILFSRSGNPGGLDYAKTDAFEIGFSYMVSNEIVLDMVSYYRDIDGNISTKQFFRDYWQYHSEKRVRYWTQGYTNKDVGNIKGMDLSLRKRFSQNFSLNVNYTLEFARTTGSQYTGPASPVDPVVNEPYVPPDELRPLDQDRTHSFATVFNYLFPEDFRAGTLANPILKNTRVYAIYTFRSGLPYGLQGFDAEGYEIFYPNIYRERWKQNIDLRLSKTFQIGGKKRLSVFTEIFNVLNTKEQGRYPMGYTFKANSLVTGGANVSWTWEETSDFNRPRFNADFNQDGVLTPVEAAKGNMAYHMMYDTMDKRAWGLARQIRSGVQLEF